MDENVLREYIEGVCGLDTSDPSSIVPAIDKFVEDDERRANGFAHVVLDDYNLDRETIEWCLGYYKSGQYLIDSGHPAVEEVDTACRMFLELLLSASDDVLASS